MSTILRTILLFLVTLVLGSALAYEVILISETARETSSTLVQVDERTGNDGFMRSVLAFQEEQKEGLDVLSRVSLTKEEIVTLIENLEDTGEELGLSVSVSSVSADANKSASTTAQIVSMTIDARGGWSKSLTFMRLLESLPHRIMIERSELTFDQGTWRNNTLLKVSIFPEK